MQTRQKVWPFLLCRERSGYLLKRERERELVESGWKKGEKWVVRERKKREGRKKKKEKK